MDTYRIRDWGKHFENNRTRDLKALHFVILPNKHDGDGYTELLDHPNGAAHYGAWVAIVQVASRGSHLAGGCGNPAGCCECRGVMLRDGAKAHDPSSLARITRIPEKVFKEVLPRLVEIGWLEVLTQENQADSTTPQEGAALSAAQSRTVVPIRAPEQNRTELNRTEGKEESADAPFSSSEFKRAMADLEKHRKEIRHKITAETRKEMYANFIDWGEEKSIRAIRQAIGNGWRGVFEPKPEKRESVPGGLAAAERVAAKYEQRS